MMRCSNPIVQGANKMSEIKDGDTVKLKSGGPVMTVSHSDSGDPNDVWCVWFAGAERKNHNFLKHTLEKFDLAQELNEEYPT